MNLYLKDFAAQLSENTHALLVMDGSSKGLRIPANVSVLLLPAYSPELNPAELIWRQLRQRKLSNRLYPTAADLESAVDEAWLWLSNQQDELRACAYFHGLNRL